MYWKFLSFALARNDPKNVQDFSFQQLASIRILANLYRNHLLRFASNLLFISDFTSCIATRILQNWKILLSRSQGKKLKKAYVKWFCLPVFYPRYCCTRCCAQILYALSSFFVSSLSIRSWKGSLSEMLVECDNVNTKDYFLPSGCSEWNNLPGKKNLKFEYHVRLIHFTAAAINYSFIKSSQQIKIETLSSWEWL